MPRWYVETTPTRIIIWPPAPKITLALSMESAIRSLWTILPNVSRTPKIPRLSLSQETLGTFASLIQIVPQTTVLTVFARQWATSVVRIPLELPDAQSEHFAILTTNASRLSLQAPHVTRFFKVNAESPEFVFWTTTSLQPACLTFLSRVGKEWDRFLTRISVRVYKFSISLEASSACLGLRAWIVRAQDILLERSAMWISTLILSTWHKPMSLLL